ncbi:MAG: DNA primase [Firmicutes bacterium]|nr:DNA primase [Bacillota bacterium]
MNFSPDFIEKVKDANNIATTVGRYLPLKQKGRDFWACCPFHHEKTPSFSVSEQNGFYHCFGCGVSGNVIGFIQHVENLNFPDAIEHLARLANIELPKVSATPEQLQQYKAREKAFEIVEKTLVFYKKNMNEVAKKYLVGRGLNDELIAKFDIGKSPDWDKTIVFLKQEGFSEQDILDSGVAAKNDRGKLYDAMAGRITFPIFDLMGRCIGFTGRVMPADDNGNVAKYRNTAQTAIFDKGKIVYGANVLNTFLRTNKLDKLIMVEGNVDVISLVAAGFSGTIASMGTAFTDFHAKAIKRFARHTDNQVYLCFDGDKAGRTATIKALEIMDGHDLFVRVIALPDDVDPDSFVRQNGKTKFRDLIESARPSVDYRLDVLESQIDMKDNIGKKRFLDGAKDVLSRIRDGAEREMYIPRVSEKSGLDQSVVKKMLGKESTASATIPKAQKKPTVPIDADKGKSYMRAVNFVVASRIHGKKYASEKLEFDIGIPIFDKIIDMKICDVLDLPENEKSEIDHLFGYKFDMDEMGLENNYKNSVEFLITYNSKKRIDELNKLATVAASEGKADDMRKYLAESQELQRRIKKCHC